MWAFPLQAYSVFVVALLLGLYSRVLLSGVVDQDMQQGMGVLCLLSVKTLAHTVRALCAEKVRSQGHAQGFPSPLAVWHPGCAMMWQR